MLKTLFLQALYTENLRAYMPPTIFFLFVSILYHKTENAYFAAGTGAQLEKCRYMIYNNVRFYTDRQDTDG